MQVGILGPLEVRDDAGDLVVVAGTRLRALLARLALDAGRPVSVATLADAIWGERLPADQANALQTLVSRLRRLLGASVTIDQSAAGYRLPVERDDVDCFRFERLAAEGIAALRAGDASAASGKLGEALALWRGPALVDTGEWASVPASRLNELRLSAFLDRAEAELMLGRAVDVVAELEARGEQFPLHERLAGLLVQALAQTGRQADALATFERVRARLADELGVDPSAELRATHLAVLRGQLNTTRPEPDERAEPRTNLKAQLTSFVGRQDDLSRIGKCIQDNRLVTLVGPGGAGKTRLACEAAGALVEYVPDGIWLVELAPVTDGADLPQAVLGSLGIREAHLLERRNQLSARDATSRLLETLSDKHAVLVLDNCEHLVEASAQLADDLLARCPQLRILATSREPLGIFGEALLVVPTLGQPDPGTGVADAMGFPAVRLFVDRAAAQAPEFVVDDSTIDSVIEIVRRLDGLPLAIELAAARLRSMPLAEIASRLSDRFRLLTGGSRTAMPRHRTLRAVVEWSWDLLSPQERTLAERLAVFASDATTASACAVGAGTFSADSVDVPEEQIPDLLASLVDKSLLQPVNGGTRLRMLETIREYGIERLAERGELAEVRHRLADYCAWLLAEAEPHLVSADQVPWFELLQAERGNVLASIRFRVDAGDADGALDIGVRLASVAMLLGNHAEVPLLVDDALAVPGGRDHELRIVGEALHLLNSAVATPHPEGDDGERATQRLQQVARELGEVDLRRHSLLGLLRVAVAIFAGDHELADHYVADALTLEDEWTTASVLMFRANLAENRGDIKAMRADAAAALVRFRGLGERWGTASTLRATALVHTFDGDFEAAEREYTEAMELMRELHCADDEGFMWVRLAELRLRQGDAAGAREQIAHARAAVTARGAMIELMFVTSVAALIERELGNLDEARRLGREALAQMDQVPVAHPFHGHMHAAALATAMSLARMDGELELARRYARESYAMAVATTDMAIVAACGVGIAELLLDEGNCGLAAAVLGATAAIRGVADPTAVDVARATRELTARLGSSAFAVAYERGRALNRDAALALIDPSA